MQHLICKCPSIGLQVRHLSRRHRKPPKPRKKRPTNARTRVINQHELAWRYEKSDSLRTALMRQYEQDERPKWSRATVQIGQSFKVGYRTPSQESSPKVSMNRDSHESQITRHEDVQCGIFWDIENVHNESHPPAIVIEAIRDFAGCSNTPVFQAYMSRQPLSIESRIHAIYAQLGVTFIHCHGMGKDTADKKIISDMWKFYVSAQKSSPTSLVRIILITGDRDFADAIGQLRNFGVEIGILTGHVQSTAPVFDDYTLGMRVLPLLGIVEARARDHDLKIYQASKRLSLSQYQSEISQDDFEDEESEISAIEDKLLEEHKMKGQGDKPKAIFDDPFHPETAKDQTDLEPPPSQNQPGPMESGTLQAPNESQTREATSDPSPTPETGSPPNKHSPEVVDSKQSRPSTDMTTLETAGEQTLFEKGSSTPPSKSVEPPLLKDRADRRGFFSRLKGFWSRDAEPSFLIPKIPSTTTETLISTTQPREGVSPDVSSELNTASEDQPDSSSTPTDTPWTSSISCRKLTQPIPIESTLFGASAIPPPSIIQKMPPLNAPATFAPHLAHYPGPLPIATSDLIRHYRDEVFLHKPAELDLADMGRLLTSWLRIESWSNVTSEESIRHAARIALTKAHEHVSRRREADQWRQEMMDVEKMTERTVFEDVFAGNGKLSYPLTEQLVSSEDQDDSDSPSQTPSTSNSHKNTPITSADIGNIRIKRAAPSHSAKYQESPQEESTIEEPWHNVPATVRENRQSGTSPSLFEPGTQQSDSKIHSQLSASLAVTHVDAKAPTP